MTRSRVEILYHSFMLHFFFILFSGLVAMGVYRTLTPNADTLRITLRALAFFVIGSCWLTAFLWQDNKSTDFPADTVFIISLFTLSALWCASWWPSQHITLSIGTALTANALFIMLSGLQPGWVSCITISALILITFWLCRAMHTLQHPRLRTLLHSLTTLPVMVLGIPLIIFHFLDRPVFLPVETSPPSLVAIFLAFLSIFVFVISANELAKTGGTPDPWDPPLHLVISGIYHLVKHPIQYAQIGLIFSAALILNDSYIWLYAVLFSLALVGPHRYLETLLLKDRLA